MLFDSHAHLNDARFDEDREALIKKLQEEHVDLVLNPGADIETSISSVELANKYDFIYAAVGVHPHVLLFFCLCFCFFHLLMLPWPELCQVTLFIC